MKTKYLLQKALAIIVVSGLLAALSCSQDPIFYTISKETVPLEPLIKGAPTKIVTIKRANPWDPDAVEPVEVMCTASDNLYMYAKGEDGVSRWNIPELSISQPTGKIIALASTQKRLYALCLEDSGVRAALRYVDLEQPGDSLDWTWKTIPVSGDYSLIQSIHADPATDRLFAGARKDDNENESHAILYLTDSDTLETLIETDKGSITGTVFSDNLYYLCTNGRGIYTVSEEGLASKVCTQLGDSANTDRKNLQFMGIIKLEDNTIIVIERVYGYLYTVTKDSFTNMNLTGTENKIMTGKYATGALALWTDPTLANDDNPGNDKKLLVAGIQGGLYNTTTSSYYTHGYVEFELNTDGSFNYGAARNDPGSLDTVADNDRYTATLGKHPINHLFQTTESINSERIFFASTQTSGLWSYRDRPANGGWQWNAEN